MAEAGAGGVHGRRPSRQPARSRRGSGKPRWPGLIAYAPGRRPGVPDAGARRRARSVFSKKEQEELAASSPAPGIEIVEGIGHALHWEDPDGLLPRSVTSRQEHRLNLVIS